MLKITKEIAEHIVFFTLSGTVTVDSHDYIQNAIVGDEESSKDSVLLNFKEVTNVSSSGIGILVTACVEIQNQGRVVKFVNVSTDVLEKFDIHKVLPVFNIFTDIESAVKQIQIDVAEKGENFVRLFERININVGAKIKGHQAGSAPLPVDLHDAMATSLSKRGMFIRTDEVLDAGSLIYVRLALPGSGIFKKAFIEFLGKVVRRIEATADSEAGIGVIILHMNPTEMERLEGHLKKSESKSI